MTFSPAADKRGEHGAVWAPDGSAILFLAKRGDNTQVFRLPLSGGEATTYDLKVLPPVDDSKEPGAIPPASADLKADKKEESSKADSKPEPLPINPGGFAISPDSRWLAVWAADPETPGEKKAKEAKADAVWVDHEHHGERLYLASLKTDGAVDGSLKPVKFDPNIQAVSWSPLSDRLIVITEPPNGVSDLSPAAKAWLVSVAALDKPSELSTIPATVRGDLAWSEDGKEIVYAAQTPEDAPPGVAELFALLLSEGAKPVRLMARIHGRS